MIDSVKGNAPLQGTPCLEPQAVPVRPEDVLQVRAGLATMGHELHQALTMQLPNESFAFSPISIAPVLGMLLRGMDQPAAKQMMLNRLGLGEMDEAVVHASLGQICASLITEGSDKPKVRVANGVTGRLDSLNSEYLQDAKRHYGAEVFPAQGDILQAVNSWVSEKTEGMIPELLKKPPESDLVCLINALYFEADWSKAFEAEDTYIDSFIGLDGVRTPVKMMNSQSRVKYCELEDLQFVEKDYRAPNGEDFSFLVMLPKNDQEFLRLEHALSPLRIAHLREKAEETKVDLALPKMDFEARIDNLKEVLQSMGYPLDGRLSRLSSAAELESIIHQVNMQVDELGTKAAAATVACCLESCCMPESLPVVKVNRPFFFMVAKGEDVLFRGTVKNTEFLVKADLEDFIIRIEATNEARCFETQEGGSLDESVATVFKEAGLDIAQFDADKVVKHTSMRGSTFHVYNLSDQEITYDPENRLMIDGALVKWDRLPTGESDAHLTGSDDDGIEVFFKGTEPGYEGKEVLVGYFKDFNRKMTEKNLFVQKEGHWEAQWDTFKLIMDDPEIGFRRVITGPEMDEVAAMDSNDRSDEG